MVLAKALILLSIYSTTLLAYDGCLDVPSSQGNGIRPTCVNLANLNHSLNYKNDHISQHETWRDIMSFVPMADQVINLYNRIIDYRLDQALPSKIAHQELLKVITEYKAKVAAESFNIKDPTSFYEATQQTLNAQYRLGKLMTDTRLTYRDVKALQRTIDDYQSLGMQLIATALKEVKESKEKGDRKMTLAYEELVQKLTSEVTKQLEAAVVQNPLKQTQSLPLALRAEIENLKSQVATERDEKDLEKIKKTLLDKSNSALSVESIAIRNLNGYTTFARGLGALYSFVDPEKSARIDQALQAINTIGEAVIRLDGVPAQEMASAVAMGNYGALAMGSLQLIGAFGNGGDGQDKVFKALFNQLKLISKQIHNLQRSMEEQFSIARSEQFIMERNILAAIARLHSEVTSIKDLQIASFNLLKTVDKNLRELQGYIANRDIQTTIRKEYLSYIEECLGKETITEKVSRKKADRCSKALNKWATTTIQSDLLTKRLLQGQYEARRNFGYQINDLLEHYSAEGNSKISLPSALSNPDLLADTERSWWLLLGVYPDGPFVKDIDDSILDTIQKEKHKHFEFRQELLMDYNYFKGLITAHRKSLATIRTQAFKAHENAAVRLNQNYHIEQMKSFMDDLSNQLVYRDYDVERKQNPSGEIHRKDLNTIRDTISTIKRVFELRLKDSSDKGVVFLADNCRPGGTKWSVPLPIPSSFLKGKLGNHLYDRSVLRPQRLKLCYDVKTTSNETVGKFYQDAANWKDKFYPFRDSELPTFVRGIHHEASKISVQGCQEQRLPSELICNVVYGGEFITQLNIRGYFDNKEVLNETKDLYEKVPLNKGVSDPYSLLSIFSGVTFPKAYPYQASTSWRIKVMKLYADTQESRTPFSLDIEGVEERINFIVARSFTGFKSTPEAKRMRELVLSQDQKGTFKEEKIADQSLKIEEFKQNLELIDTSELDRSGRILDLAIYFRGPEEYDLSNKTSNMTMKDLLNEFWGLRSGQFLIRQLQDSYSLQLKTEDIEAVFKGQERILEELERRVVF